jgi:hypothetical protein
VVAYADADWDDNSYGLADPPLDPDTVQIVFHNLFPSIDFVGDFLLHYDGTIPVKVNVCNITCSNAMIEGLWTVKYYESNASGAMGAEVDPVMGSQWEGCEYLLVVITIHLPQDPAYMNQNGTICGEISVIQWNEY